MEPVVSILMSAYNSEQFIGEAIESVLAQTYQNYELLIIEDGSTDRTPEVIASYTDERIRVLCNEKNLGTLYSMRRGMLEARGKYIAVLDSDDICEPERLRKQVLVLEQKPEVFLCAAKIKLLINGKIKKREYLPVKNSRQLRFSLLFGNDMTAHSSIMFRKKELQNLGIEYETYEYCHDYNLIMSVGLVSPIYVINEELIKYRVHSQQKTSTLSSRKIYRETNKAREDFIRHLDGLSNVEKEFLYRAVWGKLKSLRDFIRLRFVLLHYARLCRLRPTLGADKDLMRCEHYRMFVEQVHSPGWYIYSIIKFFPESIGKERHHW